MAKERLLIHGSSWTVGAYKKSSTFNVDELVDGGISQLLSSYFDVTNISVQDNMNLGIWLGLREHLKTNAYDKILVCQNDPMLDFAIWGNDDDGWLAQFPYTLEELIEKNINTPLLLIEFLLERFYKCLGELGVPICIVGGPSKINKEIAEKYGLTVIEPDWITALVGNNPSYLESTSELSEMTVWLLRTFANNEVTIKEQFLELANNLNAKLDIYRDNPTLFAYHHPTALGNEIYYHKIKEALK